MISPPKQLTLHKISRTVEIEYDSGESYILPCEYLRVFSPSAEVRGHTGQLVPPVTGKENVNILSIEPVGQYAVKFIFSDGHRTGIYSWNTLYELSKDYQKNWQAYLEKVSWIKKN